MISPAIGFLQFTKGSKRLLSVLVLLMVCALPAIARSQTADVYSTGAYFYHSGYRASTTMDARYPAGSTAPTGWLKFNYRTATVTVYLASTRISSLTLSAANTATVQGEGTVNGIRGYSFTATVTDQASPGKGADFFGISIAGPNGYAFSASGTLAGGDLKVTPTNQAPVAVTGPDQNVAVGELVTLDGRNSYDPDNDPITYAWTIRSRPEGSNVVLTNPGSVTPTFVPDLPGTYIFDLVVSDGRLNSSSDDTQVIAVHPTVPPTANAGPDQSVVTGSLVALDGRGSSDPDGNPLTYHWQFFSRPAGSQAALDDPSSPTPSFTADLDGEYILQLTVNDGRDNSIPDDVWVKASTPPHAPPVADAGPDQVVSLNAIIRLDGSGSYDPEGKPLTYRWGIVSPPGIILPPYDPNSPILELLADRIGALVFELVVNDGQFDSPPDRVVVTVVNDSPTANAGPDQTALVGTLLTLDGSGSFDPNGQPLTYLWTLPSAPAGSSAALSDPTSATPTFTPDLPGLYTFELVVGDGIAYSSPDQASITAWKHVTVPDVVGLTQEAAESALAAVGLTVGTISSAYSATVPTGRVISQSPPAGSSIVEGSPVDLIVSLGPRMVAVPDVVGMAQAAAEAALEAAGLTAGTISLAYSATVPTGQVIGQSPIAGTSIAEGSPVDLVVSQGPAPLVSIAVTPAGLSLSRGQTQQYTATGSLSDGTTQDLTAQVLWESTSLGVASITSGGLATVTGLGTTTLRTSQDGIVGSTTLSGLPPNPDTLAPPVEPGVATDISSATQFLYTGPEAIQTGVAPNTIEARRVAVLRGKVLDGDNQPLPGVTIAILNHPELGQTLSRIDGIFDLAVNGGGPLTVKYEKAGYLPVHRQVQAPWRDYALLSDVMMIPRDSRVTTVDLTAPTPIQVAQGSPVTDPDGTRQATLLIPQGTQAQVLLPDGSTQAVSTLTLRLTEYTVGPNGPKKMPAPLPPNSAYTYAVEIGADEAVAGIGGKDVLLSQPVFFYVENFLNFPVGIPVPMGYYDNSRGTWVASDSGRVIEVLSIADGQADLDTDGDGVADMGLGITEAERQQLAALYPAGHRLWRIPITHFSNWDANWGKSPPPDAEQPNQQPKSDKPLDNPNSKCGSIVECENQILGEVVGVAGTPFALHYRSDRTAGYRQLVEIPLAGDQIPASLKGIVMEVEVAGRHFTQSFLAMAHQRTVFSWDGQDVYGRPLQGDQPITVRIGYVYDGVYQQVERFGYNGNGILITGSPTRQELTLWQVWQGSVAAARDGRQQGLGGWSLNVHHAYDPGGKVLYLGDGSRRGANGITNFLSITTVAGTGGWCDNFNCANDEGGFLGDGGPATQATFNSPWVVTVGPDGSLYIAVGDRPESSPDLYHVRRVRPDGIITTVAGGGSGGDGGPATQAELSFPRGLAVGPDGSLYIADTNINRVRRVRPDGIITTVAGTGVSGFGGDDGPAILASLSAFDVAVEPDGSLYIADTTNHRVRRVGPDGIITTVAGTGVLGFSGDGGPATQA
ncbi:MAG: PASTA domain-containing protein, partial [Candidatus Tectomicrobia bacterium]|nr:PASTA domain-containing protein [Candidatus Tectomicrobia bacterium]